MNHQTDLEHRMKRQLALMGLAALIFGILFVVDPEMSLKIVVTLAAVLLLAMGVLQIFDYLRTEAMERVGGRQWGIAFVVIAIGGYLLVNPASVSVAVNMVAASLFMYHGGYHFQSTLLQRRRGYERWWLSLIFSLASVAGGLYAVVNPSGISQLFFRLLGVLLLMLAAMDGYMLLMLGRIYAAPMNRSDQQILDVTQEGKE
ncbi:MAG: DUF308 domain-containing protein [Ndongobacter sp.]|nr:DUF308 domain-containing protein [Ndongobacter sp.]